MISSTAISVLFGFFFLFQVLSFFVEYLFHKNRYSTFSVVDAVFWGFIWYLMFLLPWLIREASTYINT